MSLASYWIAIWAMTKAPIGLVAAVRESSVLFGAGIAVLVLHEQLRANRIIAACLILTGLAMIRLQ
jgi:drug/metabolite transporter (DMT)-like permease